MNTWMNRMLLAGMAVLSSSTASLAEQGFYFGLGIPYNTIGGDFDGETVFCSPNCTTPSETLRIPEIDGGLGLGLLGGFKANERWSFQLTVSGTVHDAKMSGGGDLDVLHTVLDFDVKYNLAGDRPTRPYLLAGLGLHDLWVKDGAVSNLTVKVDDATYSGIGFNLGVGVDHFFNPKFSVGLGAVYHFVSYNSAEGIDTSGKLDNSLNGSGLTVMASAAYHIEVARGGESGTE